MKYNICYFFFVDLVVILCSLPFTSAIYWTHINPPEPPENPYQPGLCHEWIVFNKFDPKDVILNIYLATHRDPREDKTAYYWSAGYANWLSGFYGEIFIFPTPMQFCINRVVPMRQTYFVSLENTRKTCKEWIFIYGYDIENFRQNTLRAQYRYILHDNFIPHWVAGYAQLLDLLRLTGFDTVPVETYCNGLGINVDELMPFMIRENTNLTCEGWIKLHGFTDDKNINFARAQRGFDMFFDSQIHYLAKKYASFLLQYGRPKNVKPEKYCQAKNINSITIVPFYSFINTNSGGNRNVDRSFDQNNNVV